VYLDKYRFETDPALLGPVAAELAGLAAGLAPFDRLAGPELGAVPLAAALSLHAQLPFLIVRKGEKGYGTSRLVEGVFEPGERVLLVEDVVTSGGAALAAIEALRSLELEVGDALCVVDREEGGSEALAGAGVTLHPLFRRAELGLDSAG
jgi:orotate phosphoribosyltransferase